MNIEQQVGSSVLKAVKELYGQEVPAKMVQLQKTKREFEGSLTLVVFPLLKLSRKKPDETASELGRWLVANEPSVASFNAVGGFLNLTIAPQAWIALLNAINADPAYGQKIHSGRSRNDQVLVDLKLFMRHALKGVADDVKRLFDALLLKSEQHKDVLMPGYTHLQVAMPSSFGLWFGAHAESLCDDMLFLHAAYRMANRNPLGSAAGYGSSFPLDREMTTRLLGFDTMDYNVVYAQMGRGKTERNVAFALASVAGTLSKLAFDACLFNSQNFAFVRLPKECTTGSSIMPHKKNPDVFELIRAKANKLQALPQQITLIMNNLPTGYFRDLQIIKEAFLPAFGELHDCLAMAAYIVSRMEVNEHILDNPMYDPMFSVEEVNRRAAAGTPFRDAYKQVGMEIENGTFRASHDIHHTHAGSMGNLCNDRIAALMEQTLGLFHFEEAEEAERRLLAGE